LLIVDAQVTFLLHRMFKLPNLLTAANMLSGVLAIILALGGRLDLAPFLVFAGMIFDFFDGFLARRLGESGEMGKQLDSLADMVTFGVAPGVMIFALLKEYAFHMKMEQVYREGINNVWDGPIRIEGLMMEYPWILIPLLIPFFSIFRLAKFNLDTRQTTSFIGLPTPANALFFMAFPLGSYYEAGVFEISDTISFWVFHPVTICFFVVIMSVMLVVELPLFSLKFQSFGWKGNEFRYIFLLISSGLIIFFVAWALALIVFLYLVLSVIENKLQPKEK